MGASAAASMLERKRTAEAIATGWPAPLERERPQTALVPPALEELIAQFESLAQPTPRASAGIGPALARATVRQLALVSLLSVISASLPAEAGASQPRAALGDGPLRAVSPTVPAEGMSDAVLRAPSAVLGGVKRTSARAASAVPASPTLVGSPPPVAAAGATGQVAPAAALIVLAAACVLARRLLGRRPMDPLSWQSALLSLRLERPG